MKKFLKRTSLFLVTAAMTVSAPLMAWALEHDIVILHTNDIHCGINDNIGFAGLAQIKKDALARTPNVALVDAGDAIQGAPIGKLSRGLAVVNIMNYLGYDFCIPGNHEFDYGMDRFKELVPLQRAGYYCANFVYAGNNKQVLPGYKIMQYEDTKVAFVGASTPESLTTSTPTFFQNEKGQYIYSFCEDKSGNKLYKQLQKNIDKARKEGADYVFIVGHLGMDGTTPQWSSESVAKNTQGVDAVIDGHSHERFQLLTESNGKDANIARVIAQEIKTYEPLLKQPVGEALVQLRSNDPATGERIVRNRECSLGDFVADAYRAVLDCDVVLANGGSIRNEIKTGVISYNDLLEAFPFGNMCVVLEVNGQQILDALEMGAISYPEESGGFMQVSGLSYTIDSSVPSSIELDAKGNFVRVAGARRVSDVKIDGKPLDVKKKYTVGATSYMLKFGGDGMTMFKGARLVQDEMMSDADTIMEYLQNHLNGKVGEQYANPYGDGRIVIK